MAACRAGERGRPEKLTLADINHLHFDVAYRVRSLTLAENGKRGAQKRAIEQVAKECGRKPPWVKKTMQRCEVGCGFAEREFNDKRVVAEFERRTEGMPDDVVAKLRATFPAVLLVKLLRHENIERNAPQDFIEAVRAFRDRVN